MKKTIAILFIVLLSGIGSQLKAQCHGTVHFDAADTAGGDSVFTISTSFANELILISYDGWIGPGKGPVTVDGNPATHIITVDTSNSGVAEVYAYSAALAGLHTIVCTETGYDSGYHDNFAASFYSTGPGGPLTIASIISIGSTDSCATGGSLSGSITTTVPGSIIYCNSEMNEGSNIPYPIYWTNATFLGDKHLGNGIDASDAFALAPGVGTYTITAWDSSSPNNGCGGLTLALVAIIPPNTGPVLTFNTTADSGFCNGSAWAILSGGTPPYTFLWSPGGQTTDTIKGLCAGTYTLTVTDSIGCVDTAFVTISSVAPLGISNTFYNPAIKLFPNPVKNTLNIMLPDGISYQSFTICDLQGRELSKQKITGNTNALNADVSKLENGIYLLQLITEKGELVSKFSVIR
ncbi:MAG TPA: T9SS type A sorting domain-containing protein [Bacteroidia bacterium]|jgi:hypothetical protein|nr:T9SS type A sorting domain-containing protein [Bacteroidia bacterium]